MAQHLIFEGAELSGKSWVMAQIYKRLEPAGATSSDVLNGCYWFNCDLGFFGTAPAGKILFHQSGRIDNGNLRIFKEEGVEDFYPGEVIDNPALLFGQHVKGGDAVDIGSRCYYRRCACKERALFGQFVCSAEMPGEKRYGKLPRIVHDHHPRVPLLPLKQGSNQTDDNAARHDADHPFRFLPESA